MFIFAGMPVMRRALAVGALAAACVAPLHAQAPGSGSPGTPACEPTTAAVLLLPPGFCAVLLAEVSRPRHLAVAENGDVYVSFQGRRDAPTPAERGGVVMLRDTNGDFRADTRQYVGEESGTGVALRGGYLYFATNTAVLRYRIVNGAPVPSPDTIVEGLPDRPGEPTKSIAFSDDGSLLVSIGAATDACAPAPPPAAAPAAGGPPLPAGPPQKGVDPCRQLATRAGVWRFDPARQHQRLDRAQRWATGIRNAVALAWDPTSHALYGVSHGRSMLARWPGFTPEHDIYLPAEEFLRIDRGREYGWPYCYFDPRQGRLVLSPEYGGDGRTVGRCASKTPPIYAFPAHWGPNDLLFYTGSQFPARYRGGAFVALHGRVRPGVVFVPFAAGRLSGGNEDFARPAPEVAAGALRPNGLAQGPDGSLYIAEDGTGRVWRILYSGER